MNPLYDQFFNPQYVNNTFLQTMQQHHQHEQISKIEKAVTIVCDDCHGLAPIVKQCELIM